MSVFKPRCLDETQVITSGHAIRWGGIGSTTVVPQLL